MAWINGVTLRVCGRCETGADGELSGEESPSPGHRQGHTVWAARFYIANINAHVVTDHVTVNMAIVWSPPRAARVIWLWRAVSYKYPQRESVCQYKASLTTEQHAPWVVHD